MLRCFSRTKVLSSHISDLSFFSSLSFKPQKLLDFNVDNSSDRKLLEGLQHVAANLYFIPQQIIQKSQVSSLNFSIVKGGITNSLFRVFDEANNSVLIRIYGENTEKIIDRNTEDRISYMLGEMGAGVTIYGKFLNGRVEHWLSNSKSLHPSQMADKKISALIANKLSFMHSLEIPLHKEIHIFNKVSNWMKVAASSLNETTKKSLNISSILSEFPYIQDALSRTSSPIVFAHNDLLSGNIMYDADKNEVTFIDFEYASYNPRGFDIANFFAEHCGFECEWSNLPTTSQQYHFFSNYLKTSKESELKNLYNEVAPWMVIDHLFWGFWGIIQAANSKIDFDYIGYAKKRLKAYHSNSLRKEILNIN